MTCDSFNSTACPCPKKKCRRHGCCAECRAYHAAKGQRPYCERQPARPRAGWLQALLGGRQSR